MARLFDSEDLGSRPARRRDQRPNDLSLQEVDDHPSDSLTSQTLNADGTPKRPMNAFMIFARRRRPQLAAENQSMRTGEVSKILSKEWNSMVPSDKQFYLDQAKVLKDKFNNKYPDYVYRRRPNNSRKRRRSDAGHTVDGSQHSDHDDFPADESEPSPIERDDSSSSRQSHSPLDTGGHGSHQRNASFPSYSTHNHPYKRHSPYDNQSSYPPNSAVEPATNPWDPTRTSGWLNSLADPKPSSHSNSSSGPWRGNPSPSPSFGPSHSPNFSFQTMTSPFYPSHSSSNAPVRLATGRSTNPAFDFRGGSYSATDSHFHPSISSELTSDALPHGLSHFPSSHALESAAGGHIMLGGERHRDRPLF